MIVPVEVSTSRTDPAKRVVRPAMPDDAPAIAVMLGAYMRETFGKECPVTADVILRDGFGARFDLVVATCGEQRIGFTAWERNYDLHWGITGGNVLDMYTLRAHRGRGVAAMMVATMCAAIRDGGGVFLHGEAVDDRSRRMYARSAAAYGGTNFILGGRAFRAVASLAGQDPRTIARNLPDVAWNREP